MFPASVNKDDGVVFGKPKTLKKTADFDKLNKYKNFCSINDDDSRFEQD